MDAVRAFVLGIIEGLTEFLPVSSTGHLIIAGHWLGVDEDKSPWNMLLWLSQLAAIIAVIVLFYGDLRKRLLVRPQRQEWQRHLLAKLAVAMAPTIVLGLLLNSIMEQYLEKPVPVALALIVGAGIMEWIDRRYRNEKPMELDDVSLKQAFTLGLIQCISMWPGVSRAAATIMGGMVLGLSPRVATQFSFYLAIPTMLAASAYKLMKHHAELTGEHGALLMIGCGTAFLTALLVVAGFLEFVKRYRFTVFSGYRIVLGIAVLALFWLE